MARTAKLDLRLTPEEKARVVADAARAGLTISDWVKSRLFSALSDGFIDRVEVLSRQSLSRSAELHFARAALADYLRSLTTAELEEAVATFPSDVEEPFTRAYVGASVEILCAAHALIPPAWTRSMLPLETPYFASDLPGVRSELLTRSPIAFRRRNLFVGATLLDRV